MSFNVVVLRRRRRRWNSFVIIYCYALFYLDNTAEVGCLVSTHSLKEGHRLVLLDELKLVGFKREVRHKARLNVVRAEELANKRYLESDS